METGESYREGLKPCFDVVSVVVVEPPAETVAREGSQVAASIDEKHCLGDVVFLCESMEECRRRIGAAAVVDVSLQK